MGGVAFIPTDDDNVIPILWRKPFLKSVQNKLVSFSNPTSTINNSELELCGNVAHHDVAAQITNISEWTRATLLDNIANVYWLQKGSTTTTGPPVYQI